MNPPLNMPISAPTGIGLGREVRQEWDLSEEATARVRLPSPDTGETLTRLISETAHDLRAPLTTVRESIRLVRDGELGSLSQSQRECLSAAINQCNCAGQLVDEMVQSRQFDSGFPNVRRRWISIDTLKRQVEETLQPWVMPRRIHLLWDGPFGTSLQTYGDLNLLRRLIVNLAGNAIRVTRDGQPVMIRAHQSDHGQLLQWSVVDQGKGISQTDMDLIAAGKAPTTSTGGLGLIISRNLAAAHFSDLRIESRVGTGTAVSFHTVTGGPVRVVQAWSEWRSRLLREDIGEPRGAARREMLMDAQSQGGAVRSPRRMRIDNPATTIEVGCDRHAPVFRDRMALTGVSVGAALPSKTVEQFDALLQRTLRVSEFAYRVGERSWVIAWDADLSAAETKRADLEEQAGRGGEPIRLSWRNVHAVSTEGSHQLLATRLTDLVIRQALRQLQSDAPAPSSELPLQPSPRAEQRLDAAIEMLRERAGR